MQTEERQAEELLPCLCGATDMKMRHDEFSSTTDDHTTTRWAVVCFTCNAIGPWKEDAMHAVLAWNADKMAIVPLEP